MTRVIFTVGLTGIAMLALLSGCGDERLPPMELPDGGWGAAASLSNCGPADMCELDRWASQGDFTVIVANEDAEVSSSDSTVLQVVSAEPMIEIDHPVFCFWDCRPTTLKYLSVIAHTNGPGDAELVIDGPAGDQRRLPVHVVDVEVFQVVDESGNRVEAIDRNTPLVRLEAYDLGNDRLAAYGSWRFAAPGSVLLSVGVFDDQLEELEYAATAFFIPQTQVTTTLQISAGEALLEFPVDF